MRFIITAGPGDTKAEGPPVGPDGGFDQELFSKYMKFNEDMHKAGVLIASEGINPGAKGARVGVAGGKRTVVDGPFTETKELIGGFYIIEVGVAGRGDLVGAALPGRASTRRTCSRSSR